MRPISLELVMRTTLRAQRLAATAANAPIETARYESDINLIEYTK